MKFALQLILCFALQSLIYCQCDNTLLADHNNDNNLDILDVISMVDLVMINDYFTEDELELTDINQDGIIDILDIIKLVNKILWPQPDSVSIINIESNLVNVNIEWEVSNSPNYHIYRVYYSSQDSLENRELLHELWDINITQIEISGLSLYNDKWFWVDVVDYWGCTAESPSYKIENIEKTYELDETGNIVYSEMAIEDFEPSTECIACHGTHVEEWSKSRHGHAMKAPLFFSQWNLEQLNHPEIGERFCVQCHSPAAFVTGLDLSGYETAHDFQASSLPAVVKEGVSCTVCHTSTALSSTYFATDDLSPHAEYHLYPGEGVYFGSIEDPNPSPYHETIYSPIFERSESCLPCHDFVMRDVEAEITFTEWNRIPAFAMSGLGSCQDCHMPEKENGNHDHSFIGVDLDLSYPIGEAPQHDAVQSMLESAVEIEFGAPGYSLASYISTGETLTIPITITSLTGHNFPSGTSFSREAWIESVISHDNDIIFSSGKIESNTSLLDLNDDSLLLFTSFFLNESGDTTMSITDTYDMINKTLPALGVRYHIYEVDIPDNLSGLINIDIRLRFRALTPILLAGQHDDLLQNQPVFDMATLSAQIQVIGD